MFSAVGQGETLYAPPIQGASLQERMQNRKKERLYSRKACNRKSQMMEKKSTLNSADLFQRVKNVEIKTRALTNNIFAGEYHSAFKGRGMSFAEVREYQDGDDVRDIDWNVTARYSRPHIKIFEEERELTVMLMIDVSSSQSVGSRLRTMRESATEIAATIAFSASQNNDKIGAIFFSDKIEKYIPPQKGRKHILCVIRELLDFKPSGTKTCISAPLEYLMRVQKRRCIAFMISDFLDFNDYERTLLVANRRHDLVALRLYDKLLANLPNVGLLEVLDAENGHKQIIDTSSRKVRECHKQWWNNWQNKLNEVFHKNGIDNTKIATDEDYVKPLIHLFSSRSSVL